MPTRISLHEFNFGIEKAWKTKKTLFMPNKAKPCKKLHQNKKNHPALAPSPTCKTKNMVLNIDQFWCIIGNIILGFEVHNTILTLYICRYQAYIIDIDSRYY